VVRFLKHLVRHLGRGLVIWDGLAGALRAGREGVTCARRLRAACGWSACRPTRRT
jgi:hypothetical protein